MSEVASEDAALSVAHNALKLVCLALPHLSGLARVIRLTAEPRVRTAAVFASGRIAFNPAFLSPLVPLDAAFVIGHEMLHLALRTHDRAGGDDGRLFNIAHDLIINDMLAHALRRPIPAGGLVLEGARLMSAEAIVAQLKDHRLVVYGKSGFHRISRTLPSRASASAMGEALREAGLVPPEPSVEASEVEIGVHPPDDVLTAEQERGLYPGSDPEEEARRVKEATEAAAKAAGLGVLLEKMGGLGRGVLPGYGEEMATALRTCYRPPWEAAMQRWLDAVSPGARTFVRPSRRGAERGDVVLPGRRRDGWTLHIVLDTSGSMSGSFGRALGAIAAFCEGAGVALIHLLQCDAAVAGDEMITPEELASYSIRGGGGSSMTPAMLRLAEDPEVEAVIVLTDGAIDYPKSPMRYKVLWALTARNPGFTPGYGWVVEVEMEGTAWPDLPAVPSVWARKESCNDD